MAEDVVVMNQFRQMNLRSLYYRLIIRKTRMMIALRAGRRVQQTGQFIINPVYNQGFFYLFFGIFL